MSVPTCIYCDSKGPFSEEHVVPAGLGGDDKAWLLKDCVCAKCNTMVFSPLEAKFLRTSPIAFARLFRQPNTRKNSRSGGMPSLQTLGSDVRDQATGVLIEIELIPGGRPSILPQVLLVYPDRFSITGPDEEQTRKFIAKLLLLLGPSVHLVRKLRERPARFEVRTLTWGHEGRVSLSDIVLMTKPPKDAVWIEELSNDSEAEEVGARLFARVYRRSAGQIVCRVANPDHGPAALNLVRNGLDHLNLPEGATVETLEQPWIRLDLPVDGEVDARVITKIGVNLCAFLYGADFVRQPAFKNAVDFVRYATGLGPQLIDIETWKCISEMLSQKREHEHALLLWPLPNPSGVTLVFVATLYGIPCLPMLLAQFMHDEHAPDAPTQVIVAYREHKLRQVPIIISPPLA